MGRRGHLPLRRVEKGETRLPSSASPVVWALAGGIGRTADRGSLGEACSGFRSAASLQPGTIDELDEIHGRRHRHDLVLGPDTHRARWTSLLRVGQPDHRNARSGRGRALRDHGHVVAVRRHDRLRIDNRDPSSVAVEQSTKGRRKQSRSHRDEHLERRLR